MRLGRLTLHGVNGMRKLLFACAAIALLGCGGDSTGPAASAEGTWNLQTVNGQPLPFTVLSNTAPAYRLEIVSDQLVANSDGTYVDNGTIRETQGTTVTESSEQDTGTWTQHGSQVEFTSDADASVATATVNGNQISINSEGVVGIYARQ